MIFNRVETFYHRNGTIEWQAFNSRAEGSMRGRLVFDPKTSTARFWIRRGSGGRPVILQGVTMDQCQLYMENLP